MTNKKIDCFIADLTHTKQGIQAKCFPLGAGLVAQYAKEELGDIFNIEIFKFPDELEASCIKHQPKILALSSYAWNHELSHTFAKAYKELNKDAIIIFGGPNFHFNNEERKQFLLRYDGIDFFVFGEGEIAFSNLLKLLIENDFQIDKLKKKQQQIDNCAYIFNDALYCGEYIRIKNLRDMPSPYLSGTFDKFFQHDLIPLYESGMEDVNNVEVSLILNEIGQREGAPSLVPFVLMVQVLKAKHTDTHKKRLMQHWNI